MKEHLREERGIEIDDVCGHPCCVSAAIIHFFEASDSQRPDSGVSWTGHRENAFNNM
jgi:hypothetical protein